VLQKTIAKENQSVKAAVVVGSDQSKNLGRQTFESENCADTTTSYDGSGGAAVRRPWLMDVVKI
jgi:hypothetical protein